MLVVRHFCCGVGVQLSVTSSPISVPTVPKVASRTDWKVCGAAAWVIAPRSMTPLQGAIEEDPATTPVTVPPPGTEKLTSPTDGAAPEH